MLVLDIAEIQIASINNKFRKNSKGQLYLSPEYRQFKTDLTKCCRGVTLKPPYAVSIELSTATDADAPIKAILDALQDKGVIDDDANVLELSVRKKPIKRGRLGSVQVDVRGEI